MDKRERSKATSRGFKLKCQVVVGIQTKRRGWGAEEYCRQAGSFETPVCCFLVQGCKWYLGGTVQSGMGFQVTPHCDIHYTISEPDSEEPCHIYCSFLRPVGSSWSPCPVPVCSLSTGSCKPPQLLSPSDGFFISNSRHTQLEMLLTKVSSSVSMKLSHYYSFYFFLHVSVVCVCTLMYT